LLGEALSTSQQLLEQKHTRTAAYKKHYKLKEMDISTNPRKAETTTPENITVIQDLHNDV
jgi:hypothetical protein